MRDPLQPLEGPEIFIGLVGPAGADIDLVCQVLQDELAKVRYETRPIRLSHLIGTIDKYKDIPRSPEDVRIRRHMDSGTELRETTGRGDILALLSVLGIRRHREEVTKDPNAPAGRTAYIIRSIKHPKEIHSLRDIYGRLFFGISVYSPRVRRVDALARRIAESNGSADINKYRSEAEGLVERDEEEEGRKLGQDVTEAFPLADFFVDSSDRQNVQKEIRRFIEIVFMFPFHTPNRDEMGMHLARSAALRSADLSRQVGAVISRPSGEVISVGCNEVPAAHGGHYWPGESDFRDFQKGFDSSTKSKEQTIKEVVGSLYKAKLFSQSLMEMPVDRIAEFLSSEKGREIFSRSRIFDLLEFGRPVHAEMAAITDAARRGVSIQDAVLYSTTFPCHMCARHIISSGISKVVYIEPYPKSRVKELYDDSVSIEEECQTGARVVFTPFVGVSPRRFPEFFEKVERKTLDGRATGWTPTDANPRVKRLIITYISLEQDIAVFVDDLLKSRGLTLAS